MLSSDNPLGVAVPWELFPAAKIQSNTKAVIIYRGCIRTSFFYRKLQKWFKASLHSASLSCINQNSGTSKDIGMSNESKDLGK